MFVKQYTSKNTYAYRYLPPEEEKQKSKGEVICLISISAQGQDDSNRMAKFVWDSLIDEYIYSAQGPLESLKSALKAAENQLKTIIRNDSKFDGVGVDMNITIAAIKGENAYIAYNGDHGVVLKRADNWIDISEILRKHKVLAGSTQIHEDDLLIILTNGLKDLVLKDNFDFTNYEAIEKLIGQKEGLLLLSKHEIINAKEEEQFVEGGETTIDNSVGEDASLESNNKGDVLSESKNLEDDNSVSEVHEKVSDDQSNQENYLNDEVRSSERIQPEHYEKSEELNGFEKSDETVTASSETKIDDYTVGARSEDNNDIEEEDYQDETPDFGSKSDEVMEHRIPSIMSITEKSPEEMPEIGYGTYTERIEVPIEETIDRQKVGLGAKASPIARVKEFFSKAKTKTKQTVQSEKTKGALSILKKIASGIIGVFGFIADKIGAIIGWIGGKIKLFFDGQLGHKVWYKKFMSRVSLMKISGGGSSVKGMKIDYYRDQNNRRKRIGAVIVVILIIIAGYIGVKQAILHGEQKEVHDQIIVMLTDADTYIDSAETKANSDSDSALIDLQKANEKISQAEALAVWDEDISTIGDLKGRAQAVDDTINRRIGISENDNSIELYMDTKISFGQNSNPSDISIFKNSLSNEFLFLSDRGEASIYAVSLYDKSVTKIPDNSNVLVDPVTVSAGSVVDGELYGIYIHDSVNGVVRSLYENGNYGEFQKLTGLSSGSLGSKEITDISILTLNSNVYLLSQTDKSVLKSVRDDFGNYGVTQQYIQSDLLAQGNGILADEYYVYTISTGSQGLQRWQGGQEVGFELIDVNPGFQNITAGYTGEKMTHKMYLYDKGNSRVVVLEKGDDVSGTHPGQYVMVKQLVYRGDRTDVFTDVKGLVVDWNEEYLYVLDGLRVWRIRL